jgi:hypothetical protein
VRDIVAALSRTERLLEDWLDDLPLPSISRRCFRCGWKACCSVLTNGPGRDGKRQTRVAVVRRPRIEKRGLLSAAFLPATGR